MNKDGKIFNKTVIGYLCLAVTSLIFGTFEVVSKLIVSVGPETTNFFRFFVGGLFLVPFALADRKRIVEGFRSRDYLIVAGLGTMFVAVSMVFYQISLSNIPASTAVFVYTFNPVFIAIFAHFILGEKLKPYIVVFIFVSLSGLAFIVNPRIEGFSIYTLFPLFGAALFGLFNVLIQPYMRKYGRIPIFTMAVLTGNVMNAILLGIRGIPVFVLPSPDEILPLVYLGVFASGITYVTYYTGMEYISVNAGSIVFFIKPILSTLLAVLLLNEILTPGFVAGGIQILIGSFVLIYFREREAKRIRALSDYQERGMP